MRSSAEAGGEAPISRRMLPASSAPPRSAPLYLLRGEGGSSPFDSAGRIEIDVLPLPALLVSALALRGGEKGDKQRTGRRFVGGRGGVALARSRGLLPSGRAIKRAFRRRPGRRADPRPEPRRETRCGSDGPVGPVTRRPFALARARRAAGLHEMLINTDRLRSSKQARSSRALGPTDFRTFIIHLFSTQRGSCSCPNDSRSDILKNRNGAKPECPGGTATLGAL